MTSIPQRNGTTEGQGTVAMDTRLIEAELDHLYPWAVPQLTAQPPQHHEAPASANCYLMIAGRQVQMTIRDTDEARCLRRMEVILAQYPVATPATPMAPEADVTRPCPRHNTGMTRRLSKKGKPYYAHPGADGHLCFGQAPQQQGGQTA